MLLLPQLEKSDPDSLEGAVGRWLAAEGPALLSVTTDPDTASFVFDRAMVENASPASVVANFTIPGSV